MVEWAQDINPKSLPGAGGANKVKEMHLQTIATLFTVLGVSIVAFCLVQAEVSYRRVQWYLEGKRSADREDSERDGGA